MLVQPGRVEEIRLRRRPDGGVDVLTAPALSGISRAGLEQIDRRYRPQPDVLELAPHIRYMIGPYNRRVDAYLLHRVR